MAKLYFVVVAVALVSLLVTRKLSMTLLFENHQTCATFELIDKVLHFLGQLSGFKEEGRALKDVALDGVALPSIVARIALNGQNPPSFLYPALN